MAGEYLGDIEITVSRTSTGRSTVSATCRSGATWSKLSSSRLWSCACGHFAPRRSNWQRRQSSKWVRHPSHRSGERSRDVA